MDLLTYYTAVGGTHSWSDVGMPQNRWYQSGSNFSKTAAENSCVHLVPEQGFVWTTGLNGIEFWRRWRILNWFLQRDKDHRDWISGGENLLTRFFIKNYLLVPFLKRKLITHSHGLQLFIYALRAAKALGLEKPFFHTVIDVAGPARQDTLEIADDCRGYVANWLHIYDSKKDFVGMAGQFGDGSLSQNRAITIPGVQNDAVEGISHSKTLNEPELIKYWITRGWFDFLKQG